MNDFGDFVDVALIDQKDNLGGNLIEQFPDDCVGSEQKLNGEHLVDRNGDIVLGVVGLEPGIHLKVLFGHLNFRVHRLGLLDESQSGARLYALVVVNIGEGLGEIFSELAWVLALLQGQWAEVDVELLALLRD
jgi:hypothetical protein